MPQFAGAAAPPAPSPATQHCTGARHPARYGAPPMLPRRRIAAIAVATLLATPASALAQSAGDEQYEDPFAGENQSQATPTPTPAPAEPSEPAQAPAPSAPEAAAPAPGAAEPTSAQAPELPRTGFDAAPILIAGVLLLGAGIALRVRLRERS